MATSNKYAALKGDFFIRQKNADEQFWSLGNAQEGAFSMATESISLQSSGNEKGTLATEETSRSATLSLTLNSLATKNLKLYFYSKAVEAQAATEAGVFTLPALAEGEMYKLAHVNVSDVTVTGKTEGVDYKVLAKAGAIIALKPIAADVEGTYKAAAATAIGVFTGDGVEYEVFYASEKTGKSALFRRWKPNPAQALQLISGEFASFQLEGECLIDEGIAEGVLGRFAVVYDAA